MFIKKKIDSFTNLYSLSKTIQFSLKPCGKTLENFLEKKMPEQDAERAQEYVTSKHLIDKLHKKIIDESLSDINIDISEYAELFYKGNKSDAEKKKMTDLEAKYRKIISSALTSHADYKMLSKKELFTDILPALAGGTEVRKRITARFY